MNVTRINKLGMTLLAQHRKCVQVCERGQSTAFVEQQQRQTIHAIDLEVGHSNWWFDTQSGAVTVGQP